MQQPTQHGPQFLDDGQVKFTLWAPSAASVKLLITGRDQQNMLAAQNGWYELITAAQSGDRYKFLINGKDEVPDPASRYQPDDVAEASALVSPHHFAWPNDKWQGRPWAEAIIYELHVGTFTLEGTFKALIDKLDYLKSLGVTAVELMPLSDFSGTRGWGYDGVYPYAPESSYGTPDDLKALVAAAHARGLMIYLDVVYNHFGPVGNYLNLYAKDFFTEHFHTPWGAAINYESETEVRDFFIDNALYWLNEFRFDGLRFDAVGQIKDSSPKHFLLEMAEKIRAGTSGRHIHLMLENEHNQVEPLAQNNGEATYYNAQWSDDIHHAMHVLTTAETSGYYSDYAKEPLRMLGRCLAEGFAYQGEYSQHGGANRGEVSKHLSPLAFVGFLQNHDQIGNRALGDRLCHDEVYGARLTLTSVITYLNPQIPMIFMGNEWWTQTPFFYFCDFDGELAKAIREGRRKEFKSFPEFSSPEMQEKIPDPNNEQTFQSSKLNWDEIAVEPGHKHLAFAQKLLGLRQQHIVPLLKAGWINSNYKIHHGRLLECNWQFKDGQTLQLLANFSDGEFANVPIQNATHVWGHFGDNMPPWKCSFSIGTTP